MSGQQAFADAVATIIARIAGRSLDGDLQSFLNENFPPGGEAFDELATLCREGIDEGWLCDRRRRAAFPSMSWRWKISPGRITATPTVRST
jgi:hypothetical protein